MIDLHSSPPGSSPLKQILSQCYLHSPSCAIFVVLSGELIMIHFQIKENPKIVESSDSICMEMQNINGILFRDSVRGDWTKILILIVIGR